MSAFGAKRTNGDFWSEMVCPPITLSDHAAYTPRVRLTASSIASNESPDHPAGGHCQFWNSNCADGERMAASDINFKALPGETIALVGATGAGDVARHQLFNR